MFGLDDKADDTTNSDMVSEPTTTPVQDTPTNEPTPAPDLTFEETPVPNPMPAVTDDSTSSDDLDAIKKQAIKDLSPLVDHLDQSPEEKFHVTMMMIQAEDDKSLVGKAYEAAKAIEDDGARAQALYDLVNEINYFEHKEN